MKTLIVSILLVLSLAVSQAQEVTILDEARIVFAPIDTDVSTDGDSFVYEIDEEYSGEFAENPIAFMNANFNIHEFIEQTEDKNYDSYLVTFRSTNGLLVADFDKKGNLVQTSQNFKNVKLPLDIRSELYDTHKGWTMVKNKYRATTKGEIIDKEVYRVSLVNGKDKQKLKIDGNGRGIGVASN